ncbi:hypothetical protein MTR_0054s0260 [Medicago truncatula]|uniref:Uncharacterized protein n=1 Tax=Medicago truncatula TaxID=3880 RepID=A0A072TIH3_MEDTR|nr:hypothetical protein MTR_0054s0260 [Medicago truncatula]
MCTSFESKKFAYSNNYKGKNHMTRTQWRRYRRSKKGDPINLENQTLDAKPSLENADSLAVGNDEDGHHI